MKPKWNLNSLTWANEEKLPGFGKLLNCWLDVHRSFCENAQPNFSWEYGHNERSQIGLLANATTLMGGLSIEESCITKNSRQGRSDLWLRLYPPAADYDYLLEAKIEQYLNVVKVNETRQKLEEKLKSAREDAFRLKGNSGKFVAVVFGSLTFYEQDLSSLEQNTWNLMSYLWDQSQNKNIDAIGAIWMGKEDFQRSQERGWANRHFGMIFLASRSEN